MTTTEVFLGLNARGRPNRIDDAVKAIEAATGISHVSCSCLYSTETRTSAVCRLKTPLPPQLLSLQLSAISDSFDDVTIDILTFGHFYSRQEGLNLPHPQLLQTLDFLIPLSEFVEVLEIPDPQLETGTQRVALKGAVEQLLTNRDNSQPTTN